MNYRVGVTGHRKLLAKPAQVSMQFKEILRRTIQDQKDVGRDVEVNTGMALGFDQLVCDCCLELSIPYIAAVPCDNQEAVWPVAQKQRYIWLLQQSSRIVQVNPGPYEPWKMHARNGWIVNNSDEMIVHWDGFYQGGTGGCMKLVKSKKLPWKNTVDG